MAKVPKNRYTPLKKFPFGTFFASILVQRCLTSYLGYRHFICIQTHFNGCLNRIRTVQTNFGPLMTPRIPFSEVGGLK